MHLYFGPYSRDVGIYFPALCASIVHDVCIYIYMFNTSGVIVTVHVICGEAMPNFHCESKVTCRWIFAMKIWYFAQMP